MPRGAVWLTRSNGERDLRAHLIRCVGNPDARFDEDALRILRGLRFASVLDFEIEPATGESILSHRGLLNNVAAERIQKELVKLLCGKAVERVLLAYREVLFTILPALEAMNGFEQRGGFHCYDVYGHTVHTIACVAPEPELRVTMLLHDSGKPAAPVIMRRRSRVASTVTPRRERKSPRAY